MPLPMLNPIRFLQIQKYHSFASREKFYLAQVINVETLRRRTLRRKCRTAVLAELYASAVASKINRWLDRFAAK